jgi:putative inorganic carbon (hco3(-)) transporter
VALDVQMAFFQLFLFWQSFMLFLYIVSTVRTRQEVDFILLILVIGLALESVLMIGQQAIGRSISLGGGILSLQMVGSRVGGTLGHPNAAGSYLAMLLAPAVGILLTPTRGVQRWLAAAGLCLGTVALALTLSRGSWTAFAVSLMLVALFAWRRGWLSPTILPLSVIIGLLFFLAFQEPITARVLGDDAGSAQGRFPLMRLAFAMIEEHPILGVGANNYGLMIKQYATPEFGRDWLYVVHNHYLLVWAESGTVGFFAFVWFLLAILWRGWEGWRRNDRFLSPLALGLTAAVVGHLMHMNVDFFIHRPQVQLLWLFAGLITVIQTLAVQGEA